MLIKFHITDDHKPTNQCSTTQFAFVILIPGEWQCVNN